MEKSKVSKELLIGVELCTKHLKIIKDQLTTYLSNDMNQNGSTGSSYAIKSDEKIDKPIVEIKRGRGRPSKGNVHSTDSSNGNAAEMKPKIATKGRGRPTKASKVSGLDSHEAKKGRGRPKKTHNDEDESIIDEKGDVIKEKELSLDSHEAKKGRGRPKKTHNDEDESIIDEKDGETKEDVSGVDSHEAKKGRGRPKKTQNDEEDEVVPKKRGRPSKLESMGNIDPERADRQGRGRPIKTYKESEGSHSEGGGERRGRGRPRK